DRSVNTSFIMKDLHCTRNMRLAFKDGFFVGGAKAAIMSVTGGRFPGRKIAMESDAETPRRLTPGLRPGSVTPDGNLIFSKVDGVFKSGNATRDTIPIQDRKSTRLNSSHDQISYAVFCLKKKKVDNVID